MRIILTAILILFYCFISEAQIANKTIGCAPLIVAFSGPDGQPGYFWDFADNTSAEVQNPTHTFTSVGTFNVQLFDMENGTLIDEVTITVLPKVASNFTADIRSGCAPLTVNFTNTSIIPPELIGDVIYEWSFGGTASDEANPTFEFATGGIYTVSLKIITTDATCDDIEIKTSYIDVSPLLPDPTFNADILETCNPADTFTFSIESEEVAGLTYSWDFGDGNTFQGFGPAVHAYGEAGGYTVRLTISDDLGCSIFHEIEVGVINGFPEITRLFPDTICANTQVTFDIETDATSFLWSFGAGVEVDDRQIKSPTAIFEFTGNYEIKLRAGPRDCRALESFFVTVVTPNPAFTAEPFIFCADQQIISLQAEDENLAEYNWRFGDSLEGPSPEFEFNASMVDTFFRHNSVPILLVLEVVDKYGCIGVSSELVNYHHPEAHFIPDVTSGCAPLTVRFTNESDAHEPVSSYSLIFGDGTRVDLDSFDFLTHTYSEIGDYYVRILMETISGCRDTSDAVLIQVGEEINLDFSVDQTSICPGDTVRFSSITDDDRIDAWHFTTGDCRASHCANAMDLEHVYFTPTGELDITLDIIHDGCQSSLTKENLINISGPIADFDYMINCDARSQVMLTDNSQDATSSRWFIEGDTIASSGGNYTHTFSTPGTYTIILEAVNNVTGCPISYDSAEVVITDLGAEFSIENIYCAGEPINLEIINSVDVDTSCFAGYTWILPGQRPRQRSDTFLNYTTRGSGNQTFTLVIEDVNGCVDTIRKKANIYNIDAGFSLNGSSICLSQAVDFQDTSFSDTTIVRWDWSFGSTDKNPSGIIFSEDDIDNGRISVTLTVMNAAGCSSSITEFIDVYEPLIGTIFEPDTLVCIGDEIIFTAIDSSTEDLIFDYQWESTSGSSSSDSIFNAEFNNVGDFIVSFVATDLLSGCQLNDTFNVNVQEYPSANFELPPNIRCEDNLLFNNLSESTDSLNFFWIPGDGSSPIGGVVDLFFGYGPGNYNVELVAVTANGCADTATRMLEVIAPQGDFEMSSSVICLGGALTVRLLDTANVDSIFWDFGDGIGVANENPVTHIYDQVGTPRSTEVKLTISAANGCEAFVVRPLQLEGVLANFMFELDSSNCTAIFIDASESSSGSPINYSWFFGDGNTSSESDPIHQYAGPGTYDVTQIVSTQDVNSFCIDSLTRQVAFPVLPNLIGLPNVFTPNGDNRNDFFNVVILNNAQPYETIEVVEFKIFNRWGKLVYDNYDPANGWNGDVDGKKAPAEIYAYIVEVRFKDGTTFRDKGNVTLMAP